MHFIASMTNFQHRTLIVRGKKEEELTGNTYRVKTRRVWGDLCVRELFNTMVRAALIDK